MGFLIVMVMLAYLNENINMENMVHSHLLLSFLRKHPYIDRPIVI